MIGIKYDIESYRSLSQIFTPSNFNKIVRKDDISFTKGRIKKHVNISQTINNQNLIEYLYNQLLKNYKSEYLYKNALLNKLLLGRYSLKTSTLFNEFKIGNSIADIVILNGDAKVYEIKTEYDSLEKLNKQILDYQQFANKVYVVSNSKHIDKLLSDYKESNIGVIEFTKTNTFKEVLAAKENKEYFQHDTIFKTLRKNEYLEIVYDYFGYLPNVPNTRIFRESLNLITKINVENFQKIAFQKLKSRKLKCPELLKSRKTPYELKHICYSLNMSNKEYIVLHNFLKNLAQA